MKDDRGKLDLSLLIEQHKQEIWKYKQKESEWEYTKNLLEGTKQIVVDLSAEVVELKRANDVMKVEIDRLSEENANFKKLAKYTIEDIDDLFWDYDRMSESGQKTLDRLSRMYALKYEESNAKGARDALFK